MFLAGAPAMPFYVVGTEPGCIARELLPGVLDLQLATLLVITDLLRPREAASPHFDGRLSDGAASVSRFYSHFSHGGGFSAVRGRRSVLE